MRGFDRRRFLGLAGALPAGLAARAAADSGAASPGRADPAADCWLEVDLDAVAANLARVRAHAGGRPVMAVVKANAYGHGLVPVGRRLERAGADALAVGKCEEALSLRAAGVTAAVLNFGPFSRADALELVRHGVSQSVFTDEVTWLAEAARELERPARVHVKVDTGLGRVGVPHDRALAFLSRVHATPGVEIEGVFTPFTEDDEYDRVQLERFLALCAAAQERGISVGLRHAASSAGVLSFPAAHLDMVRPGIALYGHYPSTREYEARRIDLRPAMSLKARVSYVKTLRPGESVSYHRAFVAERETRVATLAIGYADGYPHRAAGRAEAVVRGRRCPTIALVTSNHATLDVTGAPDVAIGDEVALIGRQGESAVTAEELAAWADTSVYKILIGANPSLQRVF